MATFHYWSRGYAAFASNTNAKLGDLSAPVLVTLSSEIKHDQEFSVTNGSTQEIFDIDDDIGSFGVLGILSTQDVLLQIVIDDDGDNGEAFVVIKLRANFPFWLPYDDALAGDGTVDLFDGTADLIERLTIKNSSGSTAKVRVLALA